MYKLQIPEQVVFGWDALQKLGTLFPADVKVMVISGKSAQRNGVIGKVVDLLSPREVEVFCQVEPEPSIQQLDELRRIFREKKCTAVAAVGGGSAMDVGKVVAAAGNSEIPTAEFFYNRSVLPEKGFFMAAVPTTAGTGAEVTPNGVFTDKISGIKQSIRGGTILPSLALVDPALTVNCPPEVTAASGLDALTQGIESYISSKANHATMAWAAQSVKLIDRAIEGAVTDGSSRDFRSDMSEGTMLGGMAFAVSGLGAVHGLAHPVGARLHLPHGLVCGILLPVVLKWNLPCCREKLDALAQYCNYSNGEKLIERIEFLLEKFNIQRRLSAYGLQPEAVEWIVKNSRSGSMRANPRELSDAELTQLLQETW